EVTVRDHDIGLGPEQTRTIFGQLVQDDNAIDRAQGGHGIGHTLVRLLVEIHGGTVTVTSPGRGRGSEFQVRLPGMLTQPGASELPPAPRSARAHGRRAQVLDDNRDAADTLSMMLGLLGFDVRTLYDPAGFEQAFST